MRLRAPLLLVHFVAVGAVVTACDGGFDGGFPDPLPPIR